MKRHKLNEENDCITDLDYAFVDKIELIDLYSYLTYMADASGKPVRDYVLYDEEGNVAESYRTEYLTDERNAMVAFDIVYKKMAHFNLEEELFAIELREVLNNTVLIRLRKKEKRVEIASFIKNRYKKNHIHNRYFSRYSLPTKVITYCAYYRMFGLLSLLLILKKTFRR